MDRREFLRSSLGVVAAGVAGASPPGPREVVFHLAGGRFHEARKDLRRGQEVAIRAERVAGRPALAVVDAAGRRVGYVPRELVGLFATAGPRSATVERVRPFALPWRQVTLRARLGEPPGGA